ncbi:MAG: glycine cleavage system aminomethyltransferase GcvT [Candidatus Krumholzibacteria bacterium]
MRDLKETPFAEVHRALGAKMVGFAGYAMPVAYGSILAEHAAVRERAGLFDVSHMGELVVTGDRAKAFVNEVVTNDTTKLAPGDLQYTVMCREDGTVVDDLLVFVLDEDRVMLVVNAANIEKDLAHIRTFDMSGVEITDRSEHYALIAVQGPRSVEILRSCPAFAPAERQLADTAYYHGFRFVSEGGEILMSRTGYTGELGFEIFVPTPRAVALWKEIMKVGGVHGIEPVGLGARDTLRFEASFCLYGHELDDNTTPLEAGLGWVVKLKKESFRGLASLREEKKRGPRRKLVGFEIEGRRIARQGYVVLGDGDEIGRVTSGGFSPTLRKSLCMALVDRVSAETTTEYRIDVRGKTLPARMTALPFYESRAK